MNGQSGGIRTSHALGAFLAICLLIVIAFYVAGLRAMFAVGVG